MIQKIVLNNIHQYKLFFYHKMKQNSKTVFLLHLSEYNFRQNFRTKPLAKHTRFNSSYGNKSFGRWRNIF